MTTIIAGLFQQQSGSEDAVEELLRAGFAQEGISRFYVNPVAYRHHAPGKSAGAKESDTGVATGAVAGAAVGAATAPLLGPVGPVTGGLVGAHVGGLVGSMSKMKEHGDTGKHAEDVENAEPQRRSGMMVAVGVDGREQEDQVIGILRSLGAEDIERTDGTIDDGDWTDFDPEAPPTLVENLPERRYADQPDRRV